MPRQRAWPISVIARGFTALLGGLLVFVWALLQAAPVYAATFTVATTQDAPHTTPLDGNCTSTLAGNPCTLRAAIEAVNHLGGGPHTIQLQAPGTYLLTVAGAQENAAATGDLDINGVALSIVNTSGGSVAIDGNGPMAGNHTDRVFDIGPGAAAQVGLSGVTIQNGKTAVEDGGGGARRPRLDTDDGQRHHSGKLAPLGTRRWDRQFR